MILQFSSLEAHLIFAQPIGGTLHSAALKYQFNDFYATWKQDSSYIHQPEVLDSLYSWSEYCPYTHGQAVYQSRALLAEVADTLMGKTHCEVAYTTAQPSSKTDDWQNTSKLEQVQIYPNPVAPGEPVYLELETDAERIALYDLNGRCVKEWQGAAQSQWTLETTGLPQGLYLGRAMDSNGKIHYFKLCIAY